MPDGDHYELIDGFPKQKSMGAQSAEITAAVISALVPFVRRRQLGHRHASQTGFRCFPNNRVRKADIAFVAVGRLQDNKTPKGDIAIAVAPDLVVDVISPNDAYEEVAAKVQDYKNARIKLI